LIGHNGAAGVATAAFSLNNRGQSESFWITAFRFGVAPKVSTPEQLREFVREETVRWRELVCSRGIVSKASAVAQLARQ
jgi:tripartite-type tricarboxylate transporter receptor subunit TctC